MFLCGMNIRPYAIELRRRLKSKKTDSLLRRLTITEVIPINFGAKFKVAAP